MKLLYLLAAIPPQFLGDRNGLENSEDRRIAGGHGNKYVRLRGAQIADSVATCPGPRASSAS
jgi:hypothetical protein